jgi:hypothetical protein
MPQQIFGHRLSVLDVINYRIKGIQILQRDDIDERVGEIINETPGTEGWSVITELTPSPITIFLTLSPNPAT